MEGFIRVTARLVRAALEAYERKWAFLGVAVLAFFANVLVLSWFGLLPDPQAVPTVALTASPLVAVADVASVTPAAAEDPVKVVIPAISLSATVADPTTTDIDALDALLLKGAVHYPTSAKLGEDGNVVLFGHSSYLPVVGNQAYKTFDGIQKLAAGDLITVYSNDAVYTYAVRSVSKEDATSAAIPLSVSGKVLTLATCDSFGAKTDRFIVTADFVESHALSS